MAPSPDDEGHGANEVVVYVGPFDGGEMFCQYLSVSGGVDARCVPAAPPGGVAAANLANATHVAVVVPADQVEAARAYFNPPEEGDEAKVQAHLRHAPRDLLRLGFLTGAVLLAVTTAFGFWSRYWPLPAFACGLFIAGLVGEGLRRRKRSSADAEAGAGADADAGELPDPS